jgi:hypothetical protein
MKRLSVILLTGLFLLSGGYLTAQKLVSGSVDMLKGEKVLNLAYDYSHMTVGKYKNEQDYVTKKKDDMNKKEAGSGDKWAEGWVNDRAGRYQPRFENNFNMVLSNFGVSAKENAPNAKYTLIIKTTFTEPGFNIGMMRQNAYIDMTVDVVETAAMDKVLGSIEMKKLQSVYMGGYDFDTGARIESCYDRAADNLGAFLVKEAFK